MSFGVGVFWALCGVIAAVSASNKGRSSFGWFFLGLLLGPIGVVLSLVVSKQTEVIEAKVIQSGEQKKCKYCAELIKSEAKLCKHCGKEQNVDVSDILASRGVSSEHRMFQDAIYSDDLNLINEMLDAGYDINSCDLAISHIEYAKLHNKTEVLNRLIK
ncbi:hypothetical protein R3X26_18580 [Vibrio sp. TH_r3]|uniref:hypothetical protein n=1 Tax=Vibrio sp. TH_r3 TaxID=3082084 RepID=UPI002953E098|nr:hypothetical protein [Vibrio sp. TH_r3]MDV7106390.1 hypothetical protein [Vibrio sp. TH_r3]